MRRSKLSERGERMIQTRAVQSQAEAHRQDLMASAGHGERPWSQMAARRGRHDAALGHRTPGTRWPSGASGRGATPRGLADRVRDEARRGDDPHVLSPAGPVAAPSGAPAGFGVPRHRQELWHGAAPQRPLHHARPVARGLPVGPGPPGGRDTDARRPGRAGASCSPTTGPTRRRAALRGPASTRAPTSTGIAPFSTAPRWTPGSPTWRCWPGRRATTRCSSGTPTPRSTRAPCRPAIRGCSATRGSCRAFARLIEDPWEKGSPAWGRWLAAQGFDVPANPHDLYQPIDGLPRS